MTAEPSAHGGGARTRTIRIRNPATGEFDYDLVMPCEESIAALVGRIRAAQAHWASRPMAERVETLRNVVVAVEKHRDMIVRCLSVDTGRAALSKLEVKNFGLRLERQLANAADIAAWAEESVALSGGARGLRQLHPYPLVVNITPWNFPFSLGWLDTVPALLAGAAVIIKPSDIAPRFAVALQAAIDTVPEISNVLRFVPGDARVAQSLIERADFICFTGSTATGRSVAASAAARMIPCALELGGKDALVVLDDADLEAAARTAVIGATIATGQICTSVERVYVQRPLHKEFIDCCLDIAASQTLNMDDPEGPGLGPFIFAGQAHIYRRHIADAAARGANIHIGGGVVERGGVWAPPAVLSNVSHDMLIMREETFGPAVPIMAFETDADGLELANDCRYGLGAGVFSSDPARAERFARGLRVGAVAINGWDAPNAFPQMPYDPFGASGLGPSRGGWENILRFTKRTVLAHWTGC